MDQNEWRPISTCTAEDRKKPILGWCVHDVDYFDDETGHLTLYGAYVEGLSHVEDGPHVLVWGGAFDDSSWVPDWWFRFGSEFEEAANPVWWKPIETPRGA